MGGQPLTPMVTPLPSPAAEAPKPKPKRTAAPSSPRETVVNANDPRPSFSPETFDQTARAFETYRAIVEKGGWPSVPGPLAPGAKGPAVEVLKRRLAITQDLAPGTEAGSSYDAQVAQAVKHFQMRHGLKQTGIVSGATLTAMNIPAEVRFNQLAASSRRLALSQFPFGERYVVVNIPAAVVEAVEGGQVRRRYVAVVGKPDRPSPEVETRITNINFNPTWTVPASIIKKDIVPKMRKDPGYLARSNIRILDGSGRQINPRSIDWASERTPNFMLRQDPGARNSLGQVRIDMPNKEAVYMHDTPSKNLFGSDQRFHSSGCVRIEGVRDLVTWLLAPQGYDRAKVDEDIAEEERKDVRVAKPVPVAWIYLTAYATADGMVHFRNDVYGIDSGPGQAGALVGTVSPPVSPAPPPMPR